MSYEFDAVIVLGCGINEDGSLPDDPRESVDIAAGLYESGRTPTVIFSGSLSYKADFNLLGVNLMQCLRTHKKLDFRMKVY